MGRMTEQIRVLIVDDESLVRSALRLFVESDPDFVVVGEARDGSQALHAVELHRPDLVLMDIQMPVMSGIEATRRIAETFPAIRILALTTFSSHDTVVQMLRAGASGFLVKDTDPADIVAALRTTHEGGYVVSPQIAHDLVSSIRDSPAGVDAPLEPHEELTDREREVVILLGEGRSNAEIAAALHLAEPTVKTHLSRVMTKWGVRDRVQVLIRAAQARIITLH